MRARLSIFALLFALTGCPAQEPTVDSGTPFDAGNGGGVGGGGGGVAGGGGGGGGDAGMPGDAGLVLPACLGTSLPLHPTARIPFVTVKVGTAPGKAGAFLIDLASTASWIDLNGFDGGAPTQLSCQGNPAIPGALCQFADFDYFGAWGQVGLNTADYSARTSPPRESGLIGTDFLSLNPTTLDYAGRRVFSIRGGPFCSDNELGDAGFSALSTAGFFSNDTTTLVPLVTVIPDGGAAVANYTVPNVPTVKIKVAGVDALAQLDTGFDDALVHHAININEAYLQAIQTAAPTALVRDASIDQFISTCVGLTENADGYRLAAGQAAVFVTETNAQIRREPNAVIFVKHTPQAAKVCGGIGTWTVPAAQIGTSFFIDATAVVFDPNRHRVWLPTR